MHIDARTLDNNSVIHGDICIIGAGTAGISMALDLMGEKSRILLLESGGFEYDTNIQELNGGETSGQKYFPVQSTRLRFFGGTTGHWSGMCAPFEPVDFKERDYVPDSGWPFGRNELDPFYEKANKVLGLGPYQYELEYWKSRMEGFNPFPLDDNVIYHKIWQVNPARFKSMYKEDMINAENVTLYTHATVTELIPSESGSQIQEVRVKNLDGGTHLVRAQRFILACGALQNARLLLASKSRQRYGIGNARDLVGRYFMEHLEVNSGELWLAQPFETQLFSWGKVKAELALREEVLDKEQILNGTVSMFPLDVGKHQKERMETWQNEDPREAMKNMNDTGLFNKLMRLKTRIWEPSAYQLDTRLEQAPNPNSRVTLMDEKDALGVPKIHLHWELTELDKRSLRRIIEILGQQFGRANLGRIRMKEFLRDGSDPTFPDNTNGGWHHMGTCRMSPDPGKGVVDTDCRVHGVSNLYIAGSACFPTSGAPNPTLTLVALSLRLSEHLKRSDQVMPS